MPKTQLIYNQAGVFVGPSPASGYHFLDSNGNLNNNSNDLTNNYNLVFPINRVTSASFSIIPPRQDVFHIGKLGTIKRPILSSSDVKLNFTYNMMGLLNESRIGLYCNTPSGDLMTGAFRYGTGRVCPILGMYSRDHSRIDDPLTLNWPLTYRDSRNIFIAVKKTTDDLNSLSGVLHSGVGYGDDVYTYAFGDCYLDSYSFSAAVGSFPQTSLGFTCNNIEVSLSGSGVNIPSINPRTQNVYSGINFNLPNNYLPSDTPTVLIPSDMTITIKQNSNDSENLDDFMMDFTDIKIQSLDFGFNINRKNLYGVGYKYPLDRVPTFPVLCNVGFSCIQGDAKAGKLTSLLKRDDNYDITIQLRYQDNSVNFTGLAIEYEFINAKFNDYQNSMSIDQQSIGEFSFTTELDPNDTTRGMFIKGYLSLWSWEEILLQAYTDAVLGSGFLYDYFFGGPFGYFLTENNERLDVFDGIDEISSGYFDVVIPPNDEILLGYVSDATPRPIF